MADGEGEPGRGYRPKRQAGYGRLCPIKAKTVDEILEKMGLLEPNLPDCIGIDKAHVDGNCPRCFRGYK